MIKKGVTRDLFIQMITQGEEKRDKKIYNYESSPRKGNIKHVKTDTWY